jgi:hypothetical protein
MEGSLFHGSNCVKMRKLNLKTISTVPIASGFIGRVFAV